MRIQYAILYTADLKKSRSFYISVLETQPVEELVHFIAFSLEESMLGIKVSSESREQPGCQTVILTCADAERALARCTGLGAPIAKELTVEDWGTNFSILDPDGNKVEFVEVR